LAKDGVLPAPLGRGRFLVADSVRAYVKFLRDENRRTSKTAASSRVAEARAREIELRTARASGEVVDVAEAFATLDEIVGVVVAGLSSLPARVSRDPLVRQKIELEVDAISNAMAEEARRQAEKHAAVLGAPKV
jgi:phage terminase Nu1 subunit (DNA packaging protein)